MAILISSQRCTSFFFLNSERTKAGVLPDTRLVTCPRDFSSSSYRLRFGCVYTFDENSGTKTTCIAVWRDSMNPLVHKECCVFVDHPLSSHVSFPREQSLFSERFPSHALSIACIHHDSVTAKDYNFTDPSQSFQGPSEGYWYQDTSPYEMLVAHLVSGLPGNSCRVASSGRGCHENGSG